MQAPNPPPAPSTLHTFYTSRASPCVCMICAPCTHGLTMLHCSTFWCLYFFIWLPHHTVKFYSRNCFLATSAGIWQSDYRRMGGRAGGSKETAMSEPNSHRKTSKVKVARDPPIRNIISCWCGRPSLLLGFLSFSGKIIFWLHWWCWITMTSHEILNWYLLKVKWICTFVCLFSVYGFCQFYCTCQQLYHQG